MPDASKRTLQRVIKGQVPFDTVIISDGWCGYNGLVSVGYDTHLRITKKQNGKTKFVDKGVHINSIESFWSFTKRRMAKFNDVKTNFQLHLKECEWRWNKNNDTLINELTKMMV